MTRTIRAHFDGKVIVPDEPVDLPTGTPLTLDINFGVDPAERYAPNTTAEERKAMWEAFLERVHSRPMPDIPDEALRREDVYEIDSIP